MVVLPEPVGPETTTMPFGAARSAEKPARTFSGIPSAGSGSSESSRFRRRITTRSPSATGIVETRMSTTRPPPARTCVMPSCGSRCSAMSMPARTLARETTCAASPRGGAGCS